MLRGSRTDKSGGERTKGGISRVLPVGGVIRPKGAVRRRVRYLRTVSFAIRTTIYLRAQNAAIQQTMLIYSPLVLP